MPTKVEGHTGNRQALHSPCRCRPATVVECTRHAPGRQTVQAAIAHVAHVRWHGQVVAADRLLGTIYTASGRPCCPTKLGAEATVRQKEASCSTCLVPTRCCYLPHALMTKAYFSSSCIADLGQRPGAGSDGEGVVVRLELPGGGAATSPRLPLYLGGSAVQRHR